MSEGELAQRKQLGLIGICWSIAGPGLLDNFFLWDAVYKSYLPKFVAYFPYIATMVIGVPMALFFYTTMVAPKK